jgi:hypothetical protein
MRSHVLLSALLVLALATFLVPPTAQATETVTVCSEFEMNGSCGLEYICVGATGDVNVATHCVRDPCANPNVC